MAQPVTCQNCNSAPATLQCTNCPASLCQACKDNTHSAPLFKSHVVTLLTASSAAAPAEEKKEKKEKKEKEKEKKEKAPKEKKEKKKEKKGFYSKVVDGLHYVGNIGATHPDEQKSPSSSDASKSADEKKEEKKKEEVASPRKSVKGLFGLGGKKDDKKEEKKKEETADAASASASNGAAVSPRTAQANANAAQEAKLRELALKEAEERARREEADRVVREAEEKAAAERAEKARIEELDANARIREKEREAEQAREAEAKAKERAAYDAVLIKAESEARQFLEGVLGEKLPAGELSEALRSGVVLCRALNVLRPNSVARVDTSGQAFKQRENIGYYLEACRAAGIKDEFLFVTADLFDARNVPQVLRHVIALKRHFADSAAAIASASGSAPASPATATAAAAPVSPRGRVTKPLPPPPGQAAQPQLSPGASSEERPPSWLNNVPPPPPPKPQLNAVEEESTTLSFSAKAPAAVAPAPSPATSQVDVFVPAPVAKSVQVQEPVVSARPARPYGASENGDDVDREAERLQRTMARKSGKGITFAPATKVEPAAAPASAPAVNSSASTPSVEPTSEQAGDFNWWNAKTFAELRKECERRNVKATAGGKEGFIKALMAHYGHAAPAAPAPVVSTPAPVVVATPEKLSVSATGHGGGSGSTVAEHNVAVPHGDVNEDMREQARLDRAVARKSGKFRAGI